MGKAAVVLTLLLVASSCGSSSDTAAPATTVVPTTTQASTTVAPTTKAALTSSTAVPTTTLASTATTQVPTTQAPTTTVAPTTTSDLVWKPGTYLARHCEGSTGTGFVTEVSGQECRADLMMAIGMGAEVIVQPGSSEQAYGISQYLRIFEFMDDNPDTGQFGLWGQWIG